jgi:hypothetical protein
MYETPEVGTILPAKENANPKIENPGPVHGDGSALNEWLQAQAQDTAWRGNKVLIEDYQNAAKNSPDYAARLGSGYSWAVEVKTAEAGGIYFDQVKQGPLVSTLVDA